ncbi:MAG: hypothetical protein CO108_06040 [Deltaproteobacteria bacterium CG_4_9_14_3_um_filter_63_12]|nr:MAG: hypothetical protein CO108_06040 [Deltaproteobacteria bacterium CG_4_9_14_3_um_filter_63_12]
MEHVRSASIGFDRLTSDWKILTVFQQVALRKWSPVRQCCLVLAAKWSQSMFTTMNRIALLTSLSLALLPKLGFALEPIVVERVAAERPSWLEFTNDPRHSFEDLRDGAVVARGRDLGLVRTPERVLAVHRQKGVLGVLAPPGEMVRWALDDQDRVYGCTAAGQIYRADSSFAALREDGYAQVAVLPEVLSWDLAPPSLVVLTTDEVVVISIDDLSLQRHPTPSIDGRFRAVFARTDGVWVMQSESADSTVEVWISSDEGKSWVASEHQLKGLRRDGQWIHNGFTVLSTDGHTWSDEVDWETLSEPVSYAEMVRPGRDAFWNSTSPTITLTAPVAPPVPARPCCNSLYGGVLKGGIGSSSCRGVGCLARAQASARETPRNDFMFMGDGFCPQEGPCTAADGGRPPHLTTLDQVSGGIEFVGLPEGCRPRRVLSMGGSALLLCEAPGGSALYTRQVGGTWSEEGVIATEGVEAVTAVGDDGTVVLEGRCSPRQPCPAWVRTPAPLGTKNAWQRLEVGEAIAFEPLDAGRVLVVTGGVDVQHFGLALFEAGSARTLVSEVPFELDLVGLHWVKDGCVVAETGVIDQAFTVEPREEVSPSWHVITASGQLMQHGSCPEAVQTWEEERSKGQLDVTCQPAGAKVLLSGEESVDAVCPARLRLKPGHYTLTVVAEGYDRWENELDVEVQSAQAYDIELVEVPFLGARVSAGAAFGGLSVLPILHIDTVFFINDGQYEVAPFFRMPIEERAYFAAFVARWIYRAEPFDFGFGGGIGFGSLIAEGEDLKTRNNAAFTMRYLVTSTARLRLLGPLGLNVKLDLNVSDPILFDATAGLSLMF